MVDAGLGTVRATFLHPSSALDRSLGTFLLLLEPLSKFVRDLGLEIRSSTAKSTSTHPSTTTGSRQGQIAGTSTERSL